MPDRFDDLRELQRLFEIRQRNEALRRENADLQQQVETLMTELRRRKDDGPDVDPAKLRTVDPSLWAAELGYGKWSLKLYGYALLIVAIGIAVVGVLVWSVSLNTKEHRVLAMGQERTACILTLTTEERVAFRRDTSPGATARWCWWLQHQ